MKTKKLVTAIFPALIFSVNSAAVNKFSIRRGGFFGYESTNGPLTEFIQSNIGGGLSGELCFKLPWFGLETGTFVTGVVNGNLLTKENADLFNYIWKW